MAKRKKMARDVRIEVTLRPALRVLVQKECKRRKWTESELLEEILLKELRK